MTNQEKMQKFVWGKCGSHMGDEYTECTNERHYCYDRDCDHYLYSEKTKQAEITLAHVLNALQDLKEDYLVAFYNNKIYYSHYRMNPALADYFLCEWDLTKNFHEQSSETQQAIAKLLGWEREID